MKKLLPILVFWVGFGLRGEGQWVTLPDTNFVNWLNTNGYATCLSGDQLDTTCSLVLNAAVLNCYAAPIRDLTGVQYFKNITSLDCSNDSLHIIPALPPRLNYFNCQINQLDSLPGLSDTLETLICDSNQLRLLPSLPAYLSYLDCAYNQLDSLPVLPIASMYYLSCNANHISNLPSLPAGLNCLNCGNNLLSNLPSLPLSLATLMCPSNQIDSLPTLPSGLNNLVCGGNQLLSLPTLPLTLTYLKCNYNQLTFLPTLPSVLAYLDCSNNQLNNLPALPNSLGSLGCSNNALITLPTLSSLLTNLDCGYNHLDSLPALPAMLYSLTCPYNNLIAIPPLPASLTYLWCDGNNLTSLPDFPAGLATVACQQNQLTYLPDLPNSMEILACGDNPNLTCLPQLKTIQLLFFVGTSVNCLPDYGTIGQSDPPLDSLPLCGIFNPSNCNVYWNISGKIYFDANANCIYDGNDIEQAYVKEILDSSGIVVQQVFAGGEGNYSFLTLDGSYSVRPDTSNLPFSIECPDSDYLAATISSIQPYSYSNDFALRCKTGGFDLGVLSILNSSVVPRPAATINIGTIAGDMSELYGADCASHTSGQVVLAVNGRARIQGIAIGALTPSYQSADTMIWDIPDFGNINDFSAFNILLLVIDSSAITEAPSALQ